MKSTEQTEQNFSGLYTNGLKHLGQAVTNGCLHLVQNIAIGLLSTTSNSIACKHLGFGQSAKRASKRLIQSILKTKPTEAR